VFNSDPLVMGECRIAPPVGSGSIKNVGCVEKENLCIIMLLLAGFVVQAPAA